MVLLLIVLLVLSIGFPTWGWNYNDGAYRNHSIGLGGLVLILVVILLFSRVIVL